MGEWIREEFSGVEANSHRAELVQRLDEVIGELDKGLEYLQRDVPGLQEWELRERKGEYEELRRILKEIPEAPEIPTCMSSRLINHFDLLTLVDTHRISLNTCMCTASLRRIRSQLSAIPGHHPLSLYHSSIQTPARSFIIVKFPFILLIAPKLLLRLRVVRRAGLFSC